MFRRYALVGLFLLPALPAVADNLPPVTDALTKKECGACHMAFQPALLPARSWQAMMAGLADHFGDNASLDAKSAGAITAYLTANAADTGGGRAGRKVMRDLPAGATPLRFSDTPRFIAKHAKIKPAAWADPKVKSKANCLACHPGAEQGRYDDD